MYYFGIGVVKDVAHAAELFRLGVEDDQTNSEFALGFLHFHGDVVEKNLPLAYSLFRRAAEKGHADGQIYIGRMLARGDGVAQDFAEAWFWFTIAEAQSPDIAGYYLDKYRDVLSDTYKEAAQLRARLWVPRN